MKTILTITNVKAGMSIVNNDNTDWGSFTILRKYDEGIWEIRGISGVTTLFESEFKFWSLV